MDLISVLTAKNKQKIKGLAELFLLPSRAGEEEDPEEEEEEEEESHSDEVDDDDDDDDDSRGWHPRSRQVLPRKKRMEKEEEAVRPRLKDQSPVKKAKPTLKPKKPGSKK
ncbi:unnamed protein product [Nyctereutes procyonoides]|uniref:(raccoon dog) hypothetical protein n=1 Tax=Nyctereutes procyonoides TaxID=34880 RepID=A0A811Y5E5_NYCPR|nr:unnamed protein product [Nyctereutes procyonoides]